MVDHLVFYYEENFPGSIVRYRKYVKHSVNKFYFPFTFKGVLFASRQFGFVGVVKSIIEFFWSFILSGYKWHGFYVSPNSNSIILSRSGRTIILDSEKKIATKISNIDEDSKEDKNNAYRIINKLKINGYGKAFVPEYRCYNHVSGRFMVEESMLLRERPVPLAEWGDVLKARIATDMVFFYKESGIDNEVFIVYFLSAIQDLQRLGAPVNLINKLQSISEILLNRSLVLYTAFVHGDLQRFNVLVKGGDPYIIDLGGSYRSNLFQDLYVQERWSPCPDLWSLDALNDPLPPDACGGWLSVFIEDLRKICSIEISPFEARMHLLLCFMVHFSRNNVVWSESRSPIVKLLS
jgi:hypothetical protein